MLVFSAPSVIHSKSNVAWMSAEKTLQRYMLQRQRNDIRSAPAVFAVAAASPHLLVA
jgi:hypothetical protein